MPPFRGFHPAARLAFLLGAAAAILLGPSQRVSALDSATPLSQYGHDVWDSDSGLPQNSVQAIVQTRDGYLWVGTQEGLVRFDGVRFTTFDTRNTAALLDDWVQSLCETRDGSLWVGTVTGLVRYRDGRFEHYAAEGPLSRAIIGALLETRDGSLWIGSSVGLGRLHGGRLELYTEKDGVPGSRVRALCEDREGNVWAGTAGGVARFANGAITSYSAGSGIPLPVQALAEDGEGGIWIGTGRGLVHWRDGIARLIEEPFAPAPDSAAHHALKHRAVRDAAHPSGPSQLLEEASGVTNVVIRGLLRDREGMLWVATWGGLFRLRDGVFSRYSSDNGLSSNAVLSVFEDREGSLWVGTTDGGLNRLKNERVVNYTRHDGLSDDKIWSVFEDRSRALWVGTAEGWLDRLAPGGTRFEPIGRMGDSVHALAEDASGDLWIGTSGAGLLRRRGSRLTRFTVSDGLPSNAISALCAGDEGGMWIGTMGAGLVSYRDGKFREYHVRDGLPAEAVFSIDRDRAGNVWIGTFGGGVARFKDGVFRTFTIRDGLPHDIVMSTFEDSNGDLWFCTRGGLSRLRDGRFTNYRQKEGLFHDAVQRVLADGHGYLWMTSNHGIFRVSAAELAAAARGHGRTVHPVGFNTASGLRSAECNGTQHGAHRTRDGRLWFATVKGLAMADPARIELNRTPPTVVVEEVLADRERVDLASGKVAPGKRSFEFHYTGLNFRSPGAVRFLYRLENFDNRWIDAGSRRVAYYTNLSPGRYGFRVRACNEDGVWSPEGASASLELLPRFHQTRWFEALCVFAIALGGFAAHRLRVRQLESREWFRTALAEAKLHALQSQLRPHFLFNTLNSLLALIGSDSARARRVVEQLAELLRVSLRTDPGQLVRFQEERAILEQYLDIERLRFGEHLEVSISVEEEALSADVPSFLLQPLVENAIKHGMRGRGGRGIISVDARVRGDRLAIRITDNGPGWRAESALPQSTGIGLRNTRRRLEILYPNRHSIDLANAPGGGFEVAIEIPLTFTSGPAAPPFDDTADTADTADAAAPSASGPARAAR